MAKTTAELQGWRLVVDSATPTVPIADGQLDGAGGDLIQDNFRELYNMMDISLVTAQNTGTVKWNPGNGTFVFAVDGSNGSMIIGGNTLDAGAKLQIDSTTGGVLFPRLTTSQMTTLAGIATNGTVAFDNDTQKLRVLASGAWANLN
jgi:hypothetical protein